MPTFLLMRKIFVHAVSKCKPNECLVLQIRNKIRKEAVLDNIIFYINLWDKTRFVAKGTLLH